MSSNIELGVFAQFQSLHQLTGGTVLGSTRDLLDIGIQAVKKKINIQLTDEEWKSFSCDLVGYISWVSDSLSTKQHTGSPITTWVASHSVKYKYPYLVALKAMRDSLAAFFASDETTRARVAIYFFDALIMKVERRAYPLWKT